MNLLGPEFVHNLVSLIQQAEADDTLRVLVAPQLVGGRNRRAYGLSSGAAED